MNLWKNRFTVPGWIFLASFILLGRNVLCDGGTTLGQLLGSQSALVSAGIALIAGLPVGYLISTLWEMFFRSSVGSRRGRGTGRFVDYRSLVVGLRLLADDSEDDSTATGSSL